MAAERESFGFYFSAHPIEAHRHLLAAHKVKRFDELADVGAITHVRFNIYPDGGVSRLRLFGRIA
jgi:allantoicase